MSQEKVNKENSIELKIEEALETIRPALRLHLGNVEFAGFNNGTAYVKLLGTCRGCPLSKLTLKAGIEEVLKNNVDEVKRVEEAK